MSANASAGSGVTATDGPDSDDVRIAGLGLREPTSAAAVFANVDAVMDLVAEEAPKSDEIARLTPLAGRALREAGVFRMTFPKEHGGLEMSVPDQLEIVARFGRVDAGTAWTVAILNASGHYAAHLSDEAYAELYPTVDTTTALSFYPPAKAVQVDGGYLLAEGRWDWGSGGYQADLFCGGAKVYDAEGNRVLREDGKHKYLGVWLPRGKVRQADNWVDTTGMRASGSSSYYITEETFVPAHHAIDYYEPPRPNVSPLHKHLEVGFFPLMGVATGMAQHIVDLTLEAVRKRAAREDGRVSSQIRTALGDAMAEVDMIVSGTRGFADRMQAVIEDGDRVMPPEQVERAMAFGLPVRNAVTRVVDICLDIYGSGYIKRGTEMERILRDVHVARAHPQFKHSTVRDDRGDRVSIAVDSRSALSSPLDEPWTITST
jgi:alkylation response protein AidB-like acyl-CoA dehydrogenase